MPDAPMNEIKRIAMIDFGHKRKNFKYRVKKAINIQANDTHETIIESTPNITEFDAEDMEIAIDTWLTLEDKVIISTNVIIFKVRIFKLVTMHDTLFVYNNCVGKGWEK
jgi:hypothetical protein